MTFAGSAASPEAFPGDGDLLTLSSTIRLVHPEGESEEAAAIVPDVSGDGIDDLLIATGGARTRLFVIRGEPGLSGEIILDDAIAEHLGAVYRPGFIDGNMDQGQEISLEQVAGAAGDFNGDGFQDVFFGGRGRFQEGAVAILYGYRTTSPWVKEREFLVYGLGSLFIMGLAIRELFLV